jgi:hypothetical protein
MVFIPWFGPDLLRSFASAKSVRRLAFGNSTKAATKIRRIMLTCAVFAEKRDSMDPMRLSTGWDG